MPSTLARFEEVVQRFFSIKYNSLTSFGDHDYCLVRSTKEIGLVIGIAEPSMGRKQFFLISQIKKRAR